MPCPGTQPPRRLLPLLAVRLESGPSLVHVAACPYEQLSGSGSGNHGPTSSSRRMRAERSTSMASRVAVADRNDLADTGRVVEAS